jgi:LPS sulfotransferase NodH
MFYAKLRRLAMTSRKMAIVAHARTGSTLLARSLGQHPALAMRGEVFTFDDAGRELAVCDGCPHPGIDGARFLDEIVFAAERPVVGMKLLYGHALEPPHASLWQALAADRSVRIVHLVRDDELARLVSTELTRKTGRYFLEAGAEAPLPPAPFAISAERCAAVFAFAERRRAEVTALLAEHARVELVYERDLFETFPSTLARVFEFLDLPPITAVPTLSRQAQRTPREQIANYAELEAKFAQTRFARYFR